MPMGSPKKFVQLYNALPVWRPNNTALYLRELEMLGAALLAGRRDCAAAWNFGPGADRSAVTVGEAAAMLQSAWPEIRFRSRPDANGPAETGRLQLDCSRADALLQWRGVWDMAETCRRTALWYRAWYREQRVETASDWRAYCAAAAEKGLAWTE